MIDEKKTKRLIGFFFEVGTLRKVARAHRQTLLTDDLSDNIASHSFRTAIIGWILAKHEKIDVSRVVMMCLLHDLEESRCGDQNWIHKRFVRVFEEEIRDGQLKSLPGSKDLQKLSHEYQDRKTKEAKLAKDADLLDQILILKEYAWQGNKEAEIWLKGREQEKAMFSRTAKSLAREAYKQKPSEWWDSLWTKKRR
jgi:putative hydrolase of HD superfamily